MDDMNEVMDDQVIKVLIADDSLVFRRFLGDVFSECEHIKIVGEAQNGIETLDMVLKVTPDVILLDMEMPLMDGMTTLQHLMIHRPTPTIMFSSLSEEGTARAFDALKNGAVDFLCKNFIFQNNKIVPQRALLIEMVELASRMVFTAREPVSRESDKEFSVNKVEQRVVFCEDCGSRQTIDISRTVPVYEVVCSNCGDTIDMEIFTSAHYKRNNFVTVIAGGRGAYFNLLAIIPGLKDDLAGAIIVILTGEEDHINNFAQYLDSVSSINVIKADEGTNIEAGNCYLVTGSEPMGIKPFSTRLKLQKVETNSLKGGPMDTMIESVGTMFKKRSAVIIISGEREEGEKGTAVLVQNGGAVEILAEKENYSPGMAQFISKKIGCKKASSTSELISFIKQKHQDSRYC